LTIRTEPSSTHPGIAAIERLGDDIGIMQHSRLSVPDPAHGYCLDDNARALILMHRRTDLANDVHDRWAGIFARFVGLAWNPGARRFRNFMNHRGEWLEEAGSEDSCGRALWALGVTATEARSPATRAWAAALFEEAAEHMLHMRSPRALAFGRLGAAPILLVDQHHGRAAALLANFAMRLFQLASAQKRVGWNWFEPVLAYDNCRLPEALLRAGMVSGRQDFIAVGLETLAWISRAQSAPEGHFRAVGSASFHRQYSAPIPFDQQPLEAQGMVEACEAALMLTGNPEWAARAGHAFAWFLGANDGGVIMADHASGECYDGLTPTGPNLNRGAESVLAFQLACCAMARMPDREART
jgi:hypothetical protein